MSKKWIDTKYECVKCHELKTLREGWRRAEGFVCNTCIDKADHERVVEERRRLVDGDYYESQVMLDVLRELCPIEGWYKLKSIAHEFNLKVFGIDKPDNIHVGNVLNKIGFKQKARKHRGS